MIKEKELAPLRTYVYDLDANFQLPDMKEALEQTFSEKGLKIDFTEDTISSGGIFSSTTTEAIRMSNHEHKWDYFSMIAYIETDRNNKKIIICATGRSKQAGLDAFSKNVKVFDGRATRGVMNGISHGGALGVGFAVGSAAVGMVGGGVKLAAKGIGALLRDKEAYQQEMNFYDDLLAACDSLLSESGNE